MNPKKLIKTGLFFIFAVIEAPLFLNQDGIGWTILAIISSISLGLFLILLILWKLTM